MKLIGQGLHLRLTVCQDAAKHQHQAAREPAVDVVGNRGATCVWHSKVSSPAKIAWHTAFACARKHMAVDNLLAATVRLTKTHHAAQSGSEAGSGKARVQAGAAGHQLARLLAQRRDGLSMQLDASHGHKKEHLLDSRQSSVTPHRT